MGGGPWGTAVSPRNDASPQEPSLLAPHLCSQPHSLMLPFTNKDEPTQPREPQGAPPAVNPLRTTSQPKMGSGASSKARSPFSPYKQMGCSPFPNLLSPTSTAGDQHGATAASSHCGSGGPGASLSHNFRPPSMARSCPKAWLAVLWHMELVEGGETSWLGLGFAGQQPVLCCASSPEDDL